MRRIILSSIIVSTAFASLIACKQRQQEPRPATGSDAGPSATSPDTGTLGHNGLAPPMLFAHLGHLDTAMANRLTLPGPNADELSPTFDDILSGPDASKTLADYAISCAVSLGTVSKYKGVAYSAATAYETGYPSSLLNSTGSWLGGGLATYTQAASDLYTCLVTRLNPSTHDVQIWLKGTHVTDNHVPPLAIEEAYWTTLFENGPVFYVWPSDTIKTLCRTSTDHGHDVTDIPGLNTRVCGTPTGSAQCRLRLGAGPCIPDGTGYTCKPRGVGSIDVPAIRTTLSCAAWCALYSPPLCQIPEKCRTDPACAGSP